MLPYNTSSEKKPAPLRGLCLPLAMGCCCSVPPATTIDEEVAPTSAKQQKRQQKQRLHTGESSDAFGTEIETHPKVRSRTRMRKHKGADATDADDELDFDGVELQTPTFSDSSASSSADAAHRGSGEAASEAEAAAERERVAAEEEAAAKLKAEAEARAAAAAAAKAKAEADARAQISKLNSALATRIATNATKAKTNASRLQTAAALQLEDSAAFDAFVKWEDQVQAAATTLLGRAEKIRMSKKEKKKGADGLYTLLAMEEQTRNSSFVTAMQTQALAAPLQSKSLRAYGILCDNMLNKLTRRLPTMSRETAPLVSAYLSAVSQHRDLAKAARPDGLLS